MKNAITGRSFRHYKGTIYTVVCVATHTETLEGLVIYKKANLLDKILLKIKQLFSLPDSKVWARPIDMFYDTVMTEDEKELQRFEKLP